MAKTTTARERAELMEAAAEILERNGNEPASRATGADAIRDRTPPNIIKGGLSPDSKPFSLTKFFNDVVLQQNPDRSRFELNVAERFRKGIYASAGNGPHIPQNRQHFWLPLLGFDMLGDEVEADKDVKYVKSVFAASGGYYDPEEAEWITKKVPSYKKAQSAFIEGFGGTIVQPPLQGAAIPLIRPKAAFLAAGAQTVPLPPQGRLVRPRLTSPSIAQALGEGNQTPDSTLGTGQLVMQAKKIGGSVVITEEANAFTSGTMDTLVRADLDRTLGLQLDAYAFYGQGGTAVPSGILSPEYAGNGTTTGVLNIETAYPSAVGVSANGNKLLPQYGDFFPALIGERSFDIEANTGSWVMRPGALAAARAFRADAVTSGDQAGTFVDILRKFMEKSPEMWTGRKVVQTTNIKGNLTKGNSGATLSDCFYGIWDHAILAAYGAIQFTQGTINADFLQGQYRIRAILYGDVGLEYPECFLAYRNVLGIQGQI